MAMFQMPSGGLRWVHVGDHFFQEPVPEIEGSQLKFFMGAQVHFVDVRRIEEWVLRHVDGAIHIPLEQFEQHRFRSFDKKGMLLVFSEKGGLRSRKAVALLRSWGFQKAIAVSGGVAAWQDHSHPSSLGCQDHVQGGAALNLLK